MHLTSHDSSGWGRGGRHSSIDRTFGYSARRTCACACACARRAGAVVDGVLCVRVRCDNRARRASRYAAAVANARIAQPHRGIRVGAACRAHHAPHTYCVIYTPVYIKCTPVHVHLIPRTRTEYCHARRHGEHPMIMAYARLHYARAPILRNDPLGAISRQTIARASTTTVDDRPRRDCVYHTQTHPHTHLAHARAHAPRARQT